MRKMISFKIENLPDKDRKLIDSWANEQSNIQQSLANIIRHVIKVTGNCDVMDFNVQAKLHTIFTDSGTPDATPKKVAAEPKQTTERTPDTSESNDVYHSAADLFNE